MRETNGSRCNLRDLVFVGKSASYIGQMFTYLKTLLRAASILTICAVFTVSPYDPAGAENERAGDFDYYVMALSWSPSWCRLVGDARDAEQCNPNRNTGFVLHGLWPQYEKGWPSYCRTTQRDPSRAQTRDMADIMGSAGSAWYQWKKHGRCAGLSSSDYFETARDAYEQVNRPKVLRQVDRELDLAPSVIEDAFLEANEQLSPDMVTITCKAGALQEVRICLTKTLDYRRCGLDVIRDCNRGNIDFFPIR